MKKTKKEKNRELQIRTEVLYSAGYSYTEIAKTLGLLESAVKRMLKEKEHD